MKHFQIDNCLVNVSNSFLKRYGVKPFHKTNEVIDKKLKDCKKTVLFLFDGFGSDIIKRHLPENSFLRTHFLTKVSSTFPPTTVAATTAVCSGKYPCETGWLAWCQYIKEIDKNIDVFLSVDSDTKKKIDDIGIHFKRAPYDAIWDLINKENNKVIATKVREYPIDKGSPKYLFTFFKRVRRHFKNLDEGFLYAYWTNPDGLMHRYGIDDKRVHKYIVRLDKRLERFSKRNPSLSLFIIADHGHINTKYLKMKEHPDLLELTKGHLYFEKRSCAFRVKDNKHEEFVSLFNKYYGDHFDLVNKETIINENYFGPKELMSKLSYETLPDFMALSKDEYSLTDNDLDHLLKGHHGGISKEEFEIDVMYVPSKL